MLSGTLKKIKDTGTITLGYRESSLPFSYLNKRQQPIGYSIDLCREIVEEAATELDGMDIKIALAPVTAADRLDKVKAGAVDIECGSTTSNLQRQKEVAFSPVFFVAGTKLMVPKTSAVQSYRDLAGKTVVVTASTTNEAALRTLSDKQKLGITIVTARDHAQSLSMLVAAQGRCLRHRRRAALRLHRHRAERPRHESGRRRICPTIPTASLFAATIRPLPRPSSAPLHAWRASGGSKSSTTNGFCAGCRPGRRSICR